MPGDASAGHAWSALTSSRIGRRPLPVPAGVTVSVQGGQVRVAKGSTTSVFRLPDGIAVRVDGQGVHVEPWPARQPAPSPAAKPAGGPQNSTDSQLIKARHGLAYRLIRNMIEGVATGFERALQIEGVGFRAAVAGRVLTLNIGFTKPYEFVIPTGVEATVEKLTKVVLKGADKYLVGETAARLRRIRPPDAYKGKGIRYFGEQIIKKAGKAAVGSAGGAGAAGGKG